MRRWRWLLAVAAVSAVLVPVPSTAGAATSCTGFSTSLVGGYWLPGQCLAATPVCRQAQCNWFFNMTVQAYFTAGQGGNLRGTALVSYVGVLPNTFRTMCDAQGSGASATCSTTTGFGLGKNSATASQCLTQPVPLQARNVTGIVYCSWTPYYN